MQPIAFHAKPSFSWKKGLLHGLAATGVFVVVGMIFAGVGAFGDEVDKIGEAAGGQAMLAFLLALAASYGLQTGKKGLGYVMLSLTGLLLIFQLLLFVRIARGWTDSLPLTAAEKVRPWPQGRPIRLCQPALGFSFPHPGDTFASSDILEEQVRSKDASGNLVHWLWEDRDGRRILVQVIKGVGRTESSFRSFTAGLKRGFTRNGQAAIQDEKLQWTGGRGEFTLTAVLANGANVQFRCLSRGKERNLSPLAACLETVVGGGGVGSGLLGYVRNGFELTACGV